MARTLDIRGTNVLQKNIDAFELKDKRFIVNQGGSRSSKTYSLAQLFIIKLMSEINKVLTISRKTMPSLKASVMRDFFEILRDQDLYEEANHNKTENTYKLHNNLVEFVSLDQPQKKRGTKRDYLWMNEANEFIFEDFMQLNMRTTDKVVLDYNPSDEYHWIYDRVIPRANAVFIQSTYKDNSFLDKSIIEELENLVNIDDNYWKIYGLGERGESAVTIYTNWDVVNEFPDNCDDVLYSSDFGYNHPSVVLKIGFKGMDVYIDELLYQTKLTNGDLIDKLKDFIPTSERSSTLIKADSAEPDRIEEINRAGFWCEGCRKGKGSIKDGIDTVKRFKVHITERSVNTIKEIKGYKWKVDKNGITLDDPVKFMDHAMDAGRYGIGDMEAPIIEFIKGGADVGNDRELIPDYSEVDRVGLGDDRDTYDMYM